jgi:VanZ family protein
VHRRTRWTGILLLAYLLLVLLVAFWPTPVDRPLDEGLTALLARLAEHGSPSWVDYRFVESAANVILFLPGGLLAGLLLGRRWWWLAAVIGLAASVLIETCQALLLPARFADPGDIVTNVAGACAGAVLAWLVLRRGRRQTPTGEPGRPAGSAPTGRNKTR